MVVNNSSQNILDNEANNYSGFMQYNFCIYK